MPTELTGKNYTLRAILANPDLFASGKPITIKPTELLKQLAAAYDQGRKETLDSLRRATELPHEFEALFGRR